MVNQKKLELAFRRYYKNFVNGITIEDVEEEYEENKNEIINIIELNAIEKDHILLIDLGSISSYYLSRWKSEVLINGGNSIDELKKVQIVLFYQCMIQELYKVRYPKMRVRYTFNEVVMALIHFTMFGWEKEEEILFDFIIKHFGNHLLKANNDNLHTWFLLELYLQYRNKAIMGTERKLQLKVIEKLKNENLQFDLIPKDLGIYNEALEKWATANLEEIDKLIKEMSIYHTQLAGEIGEFGEFGDFGYGFYPYEILFLIYVRQKRGLPVPQQFDDFLMNTPEAQMMIQDPEPYPEWDPLLRLIDNFYRKNYPEYIPNKHGALFQGTENLGGK